MTTAAWFNAELAGISGDMTLGALLDAGADPAEVRALLDQLGLTGWALERQPVLRGGLTATRAVVNAPDAAAHRHWRDIRDLLTAVALPTRVRDRALAVFRALAAAEGRLHGVPPEEVHFHEVGAVDALVDIVGVCAALEALGIDEVRCSRFAQGRGVVAAAHGVLPVPAPAVVQLLADVGAPAVGVDVEAELTTPTGAALMTALAGPDGFGPLPALAVTATGFGAGQRELPDRPNITQVVIGRLSDAEGPTEAAVVVETNVDDVTGEVLAHAIGRLLAAGAQDAWASPIVMKKGRPAHTVHAIAALDKAEAVAEVLLAETGSLGIRTIPVGKRRTTWSVQQHEVDGHPIRVKVGPTRVKAEHDDAARAAVALGLPLRTILARAEEVAKQCT